MLAMRAPTGPIPGLPPVPAPPVLSCDSAACRNARSDIEAARGRIERACAQIRLIRAITDFLRPFLNPFTFPPRGLGNLAGLLVALALVGLFVGVGLALVAALALVVLIAVALWGLAWLITLVLGALSQGPGRDVAEGLAAFGRAAGAVRQSCPENCRGDLTPPSC
jgi:hypothetical protein